MLNLIIPDDKREFYNYIIIENKFIYDKRKTANRHRGEAEIIMFEKWPTQYNENRLNSSIKWMQQILLPPFKADVVIRKYKCVKVVCCRPAQTATNCSVDNGGCDHECSESKGGLTRTCSCVSGYKLHDNSRKCEPKGEKITWGLVYSAALQTSGGRAAGRKDFCLWFTEWSSRFTSFVLEPSGIPVITLDYSAAVS